MDHDEIRQQWAGRSGEYSPRYYAYYGPTEASERVRARLDDLVDADSSVLELGCSSGRHLAHLHENGYEDLAGVEINADSFDVMGEEFPDLADAGDFHHGSIEEVLPRFADDSFDAVFSVETLQHVPDEETFDELARVTADAVVTVEIEGGDSVGGEDGDVNYVDDGLPLYYRNWGRIFTDLGFEQVAEEQFGNDTLRAFRSVDA